MVNLINCGILEFVERIKGKKLICFGAGEILNVFFDRYRSFNFQEKVAFIVDNNEKLSGTFGCFYGSKIPVISYKQFLNANMNDVAVLITNLRYFDEILAQLDNEEVFSGMDCYIASLLDVYYEAEEFEFTKGKCPKIPKKIHYCWFGGAPIPEHLQKLMESWGKICPDYEIIRWDENNYDITKNLYMKQAYDAKKWGFVPDYARLDIIYNHGGIYLDTDVEILKPFDDLLYDDMFCGFETNGSINFGQGFGAIKRHPLIKSMIEIYSELRFVNPDGSLNLIASPAYQSVDLEKYGFMLYNKYQNINGIAVYPTEVLCPVSSTKTIHIISDKTYSIHHFDASWQVKDKLKSREESGRKLKELVKKRCRQ